MGATKSKIRSAICAWPPCGRPFSYTSKGGRPPRTCSPKHKKKLDNLNRAKSRARNHQQREGFKKAETQGQAWHNPPGEEYPCRVRRPNVSRPPQTKEGYIAPSAYQPMPLKEQVERTKATQRWSHEYRHTQRGDHLREGASWIPSGSVWTLPNELGIEGLPPYDDHRDSGAQHRFPFARDRSRVEEWYRERDDYNLLAPPLDVGRTARGELPAVQGSFRTIWDDNRKRRYFTCTRDPLTALEPFWWDTTAPETSPAIQRCLPEPGRESKYETDWSELPAYLDQPEWEELLCMKVDAQRAMKATGAEDPDVLRTWLSAQIIPGQNPKCPNNPYLWRVNTSGDKLTGR